MSSDEAEDSDLAILRNQLIQSIRAKRHEIRTDTDLIDTDIDDVEALRLAALKSVSKTDGQSPPRLQFRTGFSYKRGTFVRGRSASNFGRPNANLIVIQTCPDQSANLWNSSNSQSSLISPIRSTSQQPIVKVVDKFSRYRSSSDESSSESDSSVDDTEDNAQSEIEQNDQKDQEESEEVEGIICQPSTSAERIDGEIRMNEKEGNGKSISCSAELIAKQMKKIEDVKTESMSNLLKNTAFAEKICEKDEILFANDKNEESVVRSRSKSIALSYITESLTSDSEEDKKSGRFKTIKKPSIRHEQPTRRKSRSRSPYSRQTNSRIEHSSRHRTSKDPRANRNRIPKVLKSTGKMKLASSGKLSEVVRTESTSGVQTTLSTKGNLICTYIGESRKSIEVQVAVTKPTERPKVSIRDRLGPKVDRPTDDLRSLLLTKRSIVAQIDEEKKPHPISSKGNFQDNQQSLSSGEVTSVNQVESVPKPSKVRLKLRK